MSDLARYEALMDDDPVVKQTIGQCFVDEQQHRAKLRMGNAERILLQSVAASTMSAHLAAAALGYPVWWITAIGQDDIQKRIRPLLGVPADLAVIDVMCFRPPARPPYKRWKKTLGQIVSWDRFDPAQHLTDAQVDEWIRTQRHKVMYRDPTRVD